MELNYQTNNRKLTVFLKGDLDHHAARGVMEKLERQIDQSAPLKFVLDLGGVTFMDSSGIALVIRAKRKTEFNGGKMTIVNVPTQAARVLEAAGLGSFFDFTSGGNT